MPEPQETHSRRLKAARALGGFKSQKALAEAIGRKKYSAATLKKVEEGRADLDPEAQTVIAQACNITPAFFTMDLRPDAAQADLREYVESVDSTTTKLSERLEEVETVKAQVEQIAERLDRHLPAYEAVLDAAAEHRPSSADDPIIELDGKRFGIKAYPVDEPADDESPAP